MYRFFYYYHIISVMYLLWLKPTYLNLTLLNKMMPISTYTSISFCFLNSANDEYPLPVF